MLIIPVIAEQFLTSLMGLADSMMVSNVDDYSLGAVQLVDSINILVNQAFAALATGGVVICSNFIGQTIDMAVETGFKELFFVSHIGKFIKVAGGIIPIQPVGAEKTCLRCTKPIPANSMYNYCNDCLKLLDEEGVQFFV